ncbi:MAG: YabP/YqfC family sporulation protein [Clostridia bacterium]
MTPIATTISENQPIKANHAVTIDRRKHTTITGVTDVCSFQENEVVLKMDTGLMFLQGQGLHIVKLVPEEGRLEVDGHVDSVIYESPKKQIKHILAWKWHKK